LVSITMKQLLEAGVHFGHQTKRWNPKMKEYIFGERNGIYIIDLQKSLKLFKSAVQYVQELGAHGKTILFLGTKRQAQDAIQEEAERCGMFYVNQRWLGGLLTNFVTIQKSIKRFRELEAMRTNGQYDLFSKKEVARYERERKKLEKNLSGIKDMANLPDGLFVIDTKRESIAIQEARKLGIPIIGVADTNCDPDEIDYIIPGNDDALRAIRLIAGTIAQAYLEGKAVYEAQQKELAEQMERQRQLQAQQVARESAARAAAAAAAEAAARRAAEGKGVAETAAVPPEAAPVQGEPGKPKTMVRKALQRKPKSKKPETDAPVEATANPSAEEESKPAEEESKPAAEESKLVATPDDNSELTNGHEASGG
jgi:small subunit ribosomal protein S2